MARVKRVFQNYADCGHSWTKVSKKMLQDLGITNKITSYSYQRGEFAYLEEDCDYSTFYHAYLNKYGIEPKCQSHYSETSKIRSYEPFDNGLHSYLGEFIKI